MVYIVFHWIFNVLWILRKFENASSKGTCFQGYILAWANVPSHAAHPLFARRSCVFLGSTRSGSWSYGVKCLSMQATPREFRPEGSWFVRCCSNKCQRHPGTQQSRVSLAQVCVGRDPFFQASYTTYNDGTCHATGMCHTQIMHITCQCNGVVTRPRFYGVTAAS